MKPVLILALSLLGVVALAQPNQDPKTLTIAALSARSYNGGTIENVRVLSRQKNFTRSHIRYQSEGLTQYGFMNTPNGQGPHAVVLVLHGHVTPSYYKTLAYTTRHADALANAGFVVLHPDYRGHDQSQGQPYPIFNAGYAIDVLNLVASVRQQAGQGILSNADGGRIGLWGHSMGGGVAIRAAVVDQKIKGVLLYGSMSSNERQNAAQIANVFGSPSRAKAWLAMPDALLEAISPINHLSRLRAAMSIHHGNNDRQVPVAWSRQLCATLRALGQNPECFWYAGAPHLFARGSAENAALNTRAVAFFARVLR